MKNLVVSFVLFLVSFVVINNANTQTLVDSLNNLEITNFKPTGNLNPNPEYLKYLTNLYLPNTNDELKYNPEYIVPTELILQKRYNCLVYLSECSETDGINDPIFEVSYNNTTFGVLTLKLSILEQMYQEGKLYEQVKLYGEYTDIIMISANK